MHNSSLRCWLTVTMCKILLLKPIAEELNCGDPMHCVEMIEIIGDIEKKNLKKELQNCIFFAAQMVSSVDAHIPDKTSGTPANFCKFILVSEYLIAHMTDCFQFEMTKTSGIKKRI